jgi:hypothetical protein
MPQQYAQFQDPAMPMALLAQVSPISQGVGTVSTPWVSASCFRAMVALIQAGVLGAAATLDAKLQQASDAAGTGAVDLAGKAIAQIVKATGDNSQAMIVVDNTQISLGFVRLSITVGGAASLIGASLFGTQPGWSGSGQPQALAASVAQLVR